MPEPDEKVTRRSEKLPLTETQQPDPGPQLSTGRMGRPA